MKAGIYTITNIITGKLYVGLSKNIQHRWAVHVSHLNKNKHSCKYLQKAWNKYGKDNFLFEILEECEEQFLCSQENYWCNMLDVHNSIRGYNDKPTSPDCKCKQTEETKSKISETRKNYKGVNHPMYGKKLTQEHIEKRVLKVQKLVYKFSLDGKFIQTYFSVKEASKAHNVAITGISACCRNKQPTCKGFVFQFNSIFIKRDDKRKRNNKTGKFE